MHYLRGRWNVFQHKHIGIKNILIEGHLCVYELLLMLINVQWEGAKKSSSESYWVLGQEAINTN